MNNLSLELSRLFDTYLPADGVGTERERIRINFHNGILKLVQLPESKRSASAEEYLKTKYHTEYISADLKMSKKLLLENMEEYASQFQPPSPSVNEEIIKKQDEIIKHLKDKGNWNYANLDWDNWSEKLAFLQAELKSLKSQSKESLTEEKGVSDEDIQKWGNDMEEELFERNHTTDEVRMIIRSRQFGAKAMRDGKIKPSTKD
jgi:hypothetical protein